MADPRIAESPVEGEEDQKLFRQVMAGSQPAFESLYMRHQGRIYRFALHMSGNAATAEEVTQEVFMVLIDSPKSYDAAKGSVAAWLYGVARNLTRRRILQTRLDLPLMEEAIENGEGCENGFCSGSDPLAELTRSEMLDLLRKAVLTLPEPYREAIVLCELEEMSYPEAAAILECAEGTVASRLHRARAMLQTKLRARNKNAMCGR
jgi:RNA polymerase sigma-70 factor (ECF subfamily)